MFTMKIRKMLTENKEDRLTYQEDSEVFTFKTKTGGPAGLIAGYIRNALIQFDPQVLEFSEDLKTESVVVRFSLRNKTEKRRGTATLTERDIEVIKKIVHKIVDEKIEKALTEFVELSGGKRRI